ncbi:Tetratricopeptide-like helical domain [Lasallia pustulata]|uniref:Tetratricopeptide-like helical domain n=1 Tax=Lasallia pustulata TaxID=136370 RepID=A0A1W5CUR7_9LECA|nr:Tetratricopeptide-like helical domain [Lasallia pustulata]
MEQALSMDRTTGGDLQTEGLCLLSLDGGGVRGLSALYILQGLMTRVNKLRKARGEPAVKPFEVFDLIGGTSTGGLIAIMLGRLEMDVDECIETYKCLLETIFKSKSLIPVTIKGKTKARFDSNILRQSIEDIIRKHIDTGRDPATELLNNGQVKDCKVFVCATRHEAANRTPARLRSYEATRLGVGDRATISGAALATSAATTFFDPVTIGTRTYADGAFGANNPVEEVLAEAKDIWSPKKDNVGELVKCFVSIGTGVPGMTPIASGAWKLMSQTLVEISTETEKTAENFRRRHGEMFKEKRVFRFNVQKGLEQVGLEEYEKQGIIETVTDLYMESEDHVVAVEDCAENLQAKKSPIGDPEVLRDNIHSSAHDISQGTFKARPRPSPKFTGRKKYLDRLDSFFFTKTSPRQANRIFLLHGMGGAGKTQICLKFSRILWVDSSNEETIKQSLKNIANHPDAKSSSVQDTPEAVRTWLSMTDKWLLIFDNADGEPDIIEENLPSGTGGHVLVTSRNPNMRRIASEESYLEVNKMDKHDAILLLLKAAYLPKPFEKDEADASAIVDELGCLALAVDQAGAYIGSGFCAINTYLEVFSRHRKKLLDQSSSFKGASKYGRAVYATWDISYEAIQRKQSRAPNPREAIAAKNAITLLQILSFFHYGNIMEETFKRAAELAEARRAEYQDAPRSRLPWTGRDLPGDLLELDNERKWDPLLFRNSIQILLSLSLIKRDTSGKTYSIHPLVHSWSRDRMTNSAVMKWAASANAILAGSVDFGGSGSSYTYRRKLVPHINAYYQFVKASQVATLSKHDECVRYGIVFRDNGNWNRVEVLCKNAVEMETRLLGTEHPDTLTRMSNLAFTYSHQGLWKEAEKLGVQVLEIHKRVLGAEHPDTLTSMSNLALTYSRQGLWKEAEKLGVQVLEIHKRVLGAEHPDTLTSMSILASTYSHKGLWKEAEKLGVQVLDISKRVLGAKHPHTLTSMNNLAHTYHSLSRRDEAIEMMKNVVNLSTKVIGADHPNTLTSVRSLNRWTRTAAASPHHRPATETDEASSAETKGLERQMEGLMTSQREPKKALKSRGWTTKLKRVLLP